MDSPITICSSEPPNSEEIITFSGTSNTFMRVPPSWEDESCKLTRNNSLDHIQKVTNWMKSIKTDQTSKFKNDAKASPVVCKYTEPVKDKLKICFNCEISAPVINRQSENKSYKSFSNLMYKCEKCKNNDLDSKQFLKKNRHKCTTPKLQRIVELEKISSKNTEVDNCTSFPTPADMPLSPESQKKELCSYLKLMNPADKKQVIILQNRRSTRVKNLNLLHEKKIQEVQGVNEIRETEGNKIIAVDTESRICFPPLPTRFSRNIDHFDNVMRKKIRLYSIDKEKGEKKVHKLNGEMINKENTPKPQRGKENIKKSKRKTFLVKQAQPKLKKIYILNHEVKRKLRSNSLMPKQKHKKKIINRERLRSLRSRHVSITRSTTALETKSVRNTNRTSKLSPKKPLEKKVQASRTDIISSAKVSPAKDNVSKYDKDVPKENKKKESVSKSKPKIIRPKSAPIFSENQIKKIDKLEEESNSKTDIADLDFLSEEHKKCIMETRLLSNIGLDVSQRNSTSPVSPFLGFKMNEIIHTKLIEERHPEMTLISEKYVTEDKPKSDMTLIESSSESINRKTEEQESKTEISQSSKKNSLELLNEIEKQFSQKHYSIGYSSFESSFVDTTIDADNFNLDKEIDEHILPRINPKCTPFNDKLAVKSLHRSLNSTKRKIKNSIENPAAIPQVWVPDSPSQKQKKNQHYITVLKEDGPILKAFYVDYNLIICQECLVSFWTQTALGNVLGAQNMWIQKGDAQRLILNTNCLLKESSEMVVSRDDNVAYIEIWMKEHKSELREVPVADVFATVYFWKQRKNILDRKVLQLENINGFSEDVQYLVLRWAQKIIVSWHCANSELPFKKTYIRCYELAADYQTVANISEIQAVEHYVSSLHTMEDCEELIMGCGENKITLWNIEYGYIVASVELTDIKAPISTVWVKCDRGFLFILQQCEERELRLIAINGINQKWKRLASYYPPQGYNRLKGACIENGIVMSFYNQGILCWNARTGEHIVEEIQCEADYILSGNYIIVMANDQINVKHAVTYLLSPEDT